VFCVVCVVSSVNEVNKKGKKKPKFPLLFRVLPNFHQCLLKTNSIFSPWYIFLAGTGAYSS